MKKNIFMFVFMLFLLIGFGINIKAEERHLDEHYLNDIFKTSKDKKGLSRTEYVNFIKEHMSWYKDHDYEDGVGESPACYKAQGYSAATLNTIGNDDTHGTYNCGGFVTRTFRDALKFLKNRTGSIPLLDNYPMKGHGTAASDWISQAAAYYHPNGPDRVRTDGEFGNVSKFLEGLRGKPGFYLSNADGYKCDYANMNDCIDKVLKSGIKQGDLILFVPQILHVDLIICDTHVGIYWGENGENKFLHSTGDTDTAITAITSKYELGCDYSLVVLRWEDDEPEKHYCEVVDGKYYDDKGNEVSKAAYEKACTTPEPHYCEVVDGKYYDDKGNIVSKAAYEKACITPTTHKLKITKKKDDGKTIITSSKFDFELLDSNGNSFNPKKTCSTGVSSNATCEISDLSPGDYIIEETINDITQYDRLEGCDGCKDSTIEKIGNNKFRVKITIGNADKTVTIKNHENKLTCEQKVANCGKGNRACLVGVWKDVYNETGKNWNGILNFDSPSCGSVTCTSTKKSDCSLNVSYSDGVTDNNWSCAKEAKFSGSDVSYFCGVTFKLKASNSYKNQSERISNGVESGELYFNVDDGILIVDESSLVTTCYSTENLDNRISEITGRSLTNYIKISLDGDTLVGQSKMVLNNSTCNNGVCKKVIEYPDITFKYAKEKSVKKITGMPCDKIGENGCIGIGYGILSRFDSDGDYKAKFKVEYDVISDKGTLEKDCVYKSKPVFITPPDSETPGDDWRQNIEFRTITKENPFTKKNGETRDTKSNWCAKDETGCAYDNSVVQNYITGQNDSYNSKSEEPEYTITLKPSDIKKIREDIKTKAELKYDDGSTLYFNSTKGMWYSNYLDELVKRGVLKRK